MAKRNTSTKRDDDGWVKVTAPRRWTPVEGEELIGVYAGVQQREGRFGTMTVHLVRTPSGTFYPSGMAADDLFRAVLLDLGDPVRLVYCGQKPTGSGNSMHLYELFVKGAKAAAFEDDTGPDAADRS